MEETKMQTVKIKCKICEMNLLTKFPSCLNHADMDEIEKNYVCDSCIKEGRKHRDDVEVKPNSSQH